MAAESTSDERRVDKNAVNESRKAEYRCDVCQEEFTSRSKLLQHAASHGPVQEPCLACKDAPPHGLASHIQELPDSRYECSICQRQYKSAASIFYHLRKHNDFMPFECTVCHKRFSDSYFLTRHSKTHEKRSKVHVCPFCPKTFSSRKGYNIHLIFHEEKKDSSEKTASAESENVSSEKADVIQVEEEISQEQDVFESKKGDDEMQSSSQLEKKSFLTCDRCGRRFRYENSLQKHMSRHEKRDERKWKDLPAHQCHLCERVCITPGLLAKHLSRVHQITEPFRCQTCSECFATSEQLQSHSLTHTKKKHVCEVCGRDCGSPFHLDRHMKQHTGEKPHECPTCGRGFLLQANLKAHMLTHTDVKPFLCTICGQQFRTKTNVKRHVATKHTEDRPCQCSKCGKRFKEKKTLAQHMIVHSDEREFQCDICHKKFRHKGSLTLHMSIHTQEKLHKCPYCEKYFTQLCNMNRHKRKHTGEKPYSCADCGRRFRLSQCLRRHQKTRGCSRYPCVVCGKVCVRSYHLKKHMSTHTRGELFGCSVCGQWFIESSQLETHSLTHRNEGNEKSLNSVEAVMPVKSSKLDAEVLGASRDQEHAIEMMPTSVACTPCGARFRSPADLEQHSLSHSVAAMPTQTTVNWPSVPTPSLPFKAGPTQVVDSTHSLSAMPQNQAPPQEVVTTLNGEMSHGVAYNEWADHDDDDNSYTEQEFAEDEPYASHAQNGELGRENIPKASQQVIGASMVALSLCDNSYHIEWGGQDELVFHVNMYNGVNNGTAEATHGGIVPSTSHSAADEHALPPEQEMLMSEASLTNTALQGPGISRVKTAFCRTDVRQNAVSTRDIPGPALQVVENNSSMKHTDGSGNSSPHDGHTSALDHQQDSALHEMTVCNLYAAFMNPAYAIMLKSFSRHNVDQRSQKSILDAKPGGGDYLLCDKCGDPYVAQNNLLGQSGCVSAQKQVPKIMCDEVIQGEKGRSEVEAQLTRQRYSGQCQHSKVEPKQDLHLCNVCGELYGSQHELSDHLSISHPERDRLPVSSSELPHDVHRVLLWTSAPNRSELPSPNNLTRNVLSANSEKHLHMRQKDQNMTPGDLVDMSATMANGTSVCDVKNELEIREFCNLATSSTTEVVEDVAKSPNSGISDEPCHIYRSAVEELNVCVPKAADSYTLCITCGELYEESVESDVKHVCTPVDDHLLQDSQAYNTWLAQHGRATIESALSAGSENVMPGKEVVAGENNVEMMKCKRCNAQVPAGREMQRHLHMHQQGHLCSVCGELFPTVADLKKHRKIHKGKKKILKCPECSYETKRPRKLQTHMKKHTKNHQRKKGKRVSGGTLSSKTVNGHVDKPAEMKSLKCERCNKEWGHERNFKAHMDRHAKEGPLYCVACRMRFPNEDEMAAHVKAHEDGTYLFCVHCKKQCRSITDLKLHLGSHSGERNHECSICHKRFRLRVNRDSHMKIHSGIKPYHCSVCGHDFPTKTNLTRHLATTHSEERNFQCAECGVRFKERSQLKTHMLIHTGEKSFQCLHCGKNFRHASTLRSHEAIHTSENRHTCKFCGKTFTQIGNMTRHSRIHTGEKLYQCPTCDRKFTFSASLKRHLLTHSGLKPFHCDICGKAFAAADNRNRHRNSHLKGKKTEIVN